METNHKRPAPFSDAAARRRERPDNPVESLVALDQDIMKLLVRRAKLVQRLRGGKDYAATPAAIKAEKEVRSSWEKNAIKFSRDSRFTRQLFSLLQELEVSSQAEAEERTGFVLSPAKKPVAVDLPGPAHVRGTRLVTAFAAAMGLPVRLHSVLLNEPLLECIKALNLAGAKLSWSGSWPEPSHIEQKQGALSDMGHPQLSFAGKVFYAGSDALTFYLLVFLALAATGTVRFTGGAGLKMADLSATRRFLPLLGARLAHSVPKSTGLPATLEVSGILPDAVHLPSDMPFEAVVALLCAACTWQKHMAFDCADLPAQLSAKALAEVLPLMNLCGVGYTMSGSVLRLDAPRCIAREHMAQCREHVDTGLDTVLTSYMLALPAFAGGRVRFAGSWAETHPETAPALQLLGWSGTKISNPAGHLVAEAGATPVTLPPLTQEIQQLPDELLPLLAAFTAHIALHNGGVPDASAVLEVMEQRQMLSLAQSFWAQIGITVTEKSLTLRARADRADKAALADKTDKTDKTDMTAMTARAGTAAESAELTKAHGPSAPDGAAGQDPADLPLLPSQWTSPGPYWSMALALCSYVKAQLRLSNPAVVSDVMPSFWSFFNSLPSPAVSRPVEEKSPDAPSKRRIRTGCDT